MADDGSLSMKIQTDHEKESMTAIATCVCGIRRDLGSVDTRDVRDYCATVVFVTVSYRFAGC